MKNILYKAFILVFLFSKSVSAKDWQIVDFDKFVSLQFHGRVTHGDKLDFNLSKKNCDRVNYFFSIYSAKKNPEFMNLKEKKIPLNINGVKTSADTIYTSPFLMGYRGMFYLGSYHAKDIAKFFNRITSYQIKVIDRDNFEADTFFDIDYNQWNLGNFNEAFKEAHSLCKSKTS